MIAAARALVFALLVSLVTAACGPTQNGGGADGGTLRVALPADVVTLDPAMITDVISDHVASQIHETLFTVDHELKIVPLLAERLEQPSPATYVISLRQGVKFHDGEEMTADDVVASLNRVMDPSVRSPRAARLAEPLGPNGRIEAVDRYTVRIALSEPYAPFLERLTQSYTSVISRGALQMAGPYTEHPVGTGPYKFAERVSGESISVDRNPEYWGDRSNAARIVFRPIPDNATRIASLEAGEVEIVTFPPFDEIDRLRADSRFKTQVVPAVNIAYLGFNTSRGPLADPLLRQAIASSIDRHELLAAIYAGAGRVASSPLDPASWAFEPELPSYTLDPGRARELLGRSGYRGEEIELAVNNAAEPRRVAERIQGVLKDGLGLQVKLNVMEWGAYLDYLKLGDRHQMYLLSWTGGADPDSTLFPLFHSRNWGAAGNRAWYKSERVDALLERAQVTTDQESRAELYRKAQRSIMQDLPVLPLRYGVNALATSARVDGLKLHPLNRYNYAAATFR